MRESFERVGLFSTEHCVGVTVDWFARATEAGLKTLVVPEVVLERRLHTENNGLRESNQRSQYLQVLKASIDRCVSETVPRVNPEPQTIILTLAGPFRRNAVATKLVAVREQVRT